VREKKKKELFLRPLQIDLKTRVDISYRLIGDSVVIPYESHTDLKTRVDISYRLIGDSVVIPYEFHTDPNRNKNNVLISYYRGTGVNPYKDFIRDAPIFL